MKDVPISDAPLLEWVQEGGILWSDWDVIQGYAPLRGVLSGVVNRDADFISGRLQTGMKDLDENFARTQVEGIAHLDVQAGQGSILLRADEAALVVAVPVGRGWMVVESEDLSARSEIRTTGALPEWTIRTVRQLTAQLQAVPVLQSGSPAPFSASLQRQGQAIDISEGSATQIDPGWWTLADAAQSGLVVLPSESEGELRALPESLEWSDTTFLEQSDSGADWSWWLLLSLLIFLVGEGVFAAWAGEPMDANTQTTFVLQYAEGWLLYVAICVVGVLGYWAWRRYGPAPQGIPGHIARGCRLLAIALIVFALCGPAWRSLVTTTVPGRLLVLVDHSASMQREDGIADGARIEAALGLYRAINDQPNLAGTTIEWRAIGGVSGSVAPTAIAADQATGSSSALANDIEQASQSIPADMVLVVSDFRSTEGSSLDVAAERLRRLGQSAWALGVGGQRIGCRAFHRRSEWKFHYRLG